jgi:biotin carboxyl carrier protein
MDVEIQGIWHRVEIARHGRDWMVSLGGQSWLADVAPVGDSWSVLLRDPRTPGPCHSLTMALERGADETLRAQLDGRDVLMSLPGTAASSRRSPSPGGAAPARGIQTVKAPMPGRVVKVLVRPGDLVGDRQPVVVLEAMKMQNDVRTPRAGRVGDVHVIEGALVDAASPLVTVVVGDDGPS